MFDDNYVFVDIQTTGTRPTTDRIFALEIYQVKANKPILIWSQLINPVVSLPAGIQVTTGITQEIIDSAPQFDEFADELIAILQGKIFISYNARYVYAFLKNELKSLGINWQAKTLCSTKLSKRILPYVASTEVSSLNENFNLRVKNKDNKITRAEFLADLFIKLLEFVEPKTLASCIKQLIKEHTIPSHLCSDLINTIPNTAGVYLFYGDNNSLLYIGKSVNLRKRVLSHFAADHADNKEMRLAQQIKSIDWITTAGELGALLNESHLIKQHKPILNRRLRRHKGLFTFAITQNLGGYNTVKIIACNETDNLSHTHGLFRQKRKAEAKLRQLVKDFELCPKLMGLEKSHKACFYYQLKKCKGACIQQEDAESYNIRLACALEGFNYKAWPYTGKIAIKETCPITQKTEFHIIDEWRYINSVDDIKNIALKKPQDIIFDLDIYKILISYLLNEKQKLEIIELAD